MTDILLIALAMSLLYISIANRLYTYLNILVFQGFILFGVTYLTLTKISTINLMLIMLETIVFKALAVPWFINHIIKRNGITREAEPYLPNFVSLIIVTFITVSTIILSSSIKDPNLDKTFFVVALSTIFTGLYLIVTRKKIITHVIGYIIIENGVFVLSLAVGNEMPMLVNLGIMLDIFASVLILGVFFNRIGDLLKDPDIDHLRNLKD
ncbi:MAG TPA: NADH-quinone oxidoreductase subunit K [Prolixibacteraceae bacterium]|nr:NADH-quinone oxidoreductase subunit K [Prolixibacteraceae bacterium]